MTQLIQKMLQSGEDWALLDEEGGEAVSFSSFARFAVRSEGQVLSYPIEEGSFANYNKTRAPVEISVSIVLQGAESDFERGLEQLERYKREAVKLAVATPAQLYPNMTLRGYSVSRESAAGAHMLLAELSLVEVLEPGEGGGAARYKNPSSAGMVNVGRVQIAPLSSLVQGLRL